MPNYKDTTESSSNKNAQLLSSMNDIERKTRESEIKGNVVPLAEKRAHIEKYKIAEGDNTR